MRQIIFGRGDQYFAIWLYEDEDGRVKPSMLTNEAGEGMEISEDDIFGVLGKHFADNF